jgi:hypothetical protein
MFIRERSDLRRKMNIYVRERNQTEKAKYLTNAQKFSKQVVRKKNKENIITMANIIHGHLLEYHHCSSLENEI